MKFFKRKEEKNKVGRPKLADDETKKKAIISVCVALVLVITLALTGAFKLNIIKFNKLKGTVNVNLCAEIPARFQPKSESNPEGTYDYGFTDPKFYSAVLSNGSVGESGNYLYNNSNYCNTITEEQLQSITGLAVTNGIIDNADGLQYLTGLTGLNLHNNNLDSVDVSNSANLTSLALSGNNLSNIDLKNNLALTSLHLENNNLSSLDISSHNALEYLYLANNNFSNLDVSNKTDLKWLDLSNNNLNNVSVDNNPILRDLHLSDNNLTSVNLSGNVGLEYLLLQNNNLNNIDISENPALIRLNLNNNNLSRIDVSNNTSLTKLELEDNNFRKEYYSVGKSITVEQPDFITAYPNDVVYSISYPDIATYNDGVVERVKPGRTALTMKYKISDSYTYYLSYTINFIGVTSSTYSIDYDKKQIDLNGEVLSNVPTYNFSVTPSNYSLNINNDVLEIKDSTGNITDTYTLKNYVLYKLTSQYYTINKEDKTIDLNKDLLNSVYVGKFSTNSKNYKLNINKNKLEIKDINETLVETYKFINYSEYKLNCSYYTINEEDKTIDAKGEIFKKDNMWINPSNLYELRVNENKLEILNSDKNVVDSYEIINAKTNDENAYLKAGFKDKNLYTCVVREFTRDEDIEGNYLLTDEEMNNINELYCTNQNVSDTTGIEKLTNLRYLDLSYNNIENIDLSKNENLIELMLLNNKVTNMDVTNNVSLQTIAIANNNVSKIVGLDSLESLNTLYAPNNNLQNLNLSKAANVEFLVIDSNPLSSTLYMLKGEEIDYKKDIKLNGKYDIDYDIVDTNVISYKDNKLKALKEGITNIYLSNEYMYGASIYFYDKAFKCQYLQEEKACSEIENINEEDAILPYFLSQEIKVYDVTSKEYEIDKDKKTIDALNKDFDASKINITLNGLTGTLIDDKFIIKDKDVIVDEYTITNIKKVIKEDTSSTSNNGTNGTNNSTNNTNKTNEKVINKIAERKEDVKLEDIIIEGDKVPFATLLLVKGKDRNIVIINKELKFTINGKDIDKVEGDLDLSYELNSLKESTIYEEVKDKLKNGMVLRFKDNVSLPYKILVELNVIDDIENNIGINDINIYNYDNAKYNLIAEKLQVNNNKLNFYVNKLGNYILTNNEVEDKYVKSDSDMITENTKLKNKVTHKRLIILFVIFIILIILGIIGYITYKNKEKKD